MKWNNQLTGVINILDMIAYTEPDASYDFYFFGRVNVLLGHKKVSDLSVFVDIGNT